MFTFDRARARAWLLEVPDTDTTGWHEEQIDDGRRYLAYLAGPGELDEKQMGGLVHEAMEAGLLPAEPRALLHTDPDGAIVILELKSPGSDEYLRLAGAWAEWSAIQGPLARIADPAFVPPTAVDELINVLWHVATDTVQIIRAARRALVAGALDALPIDPNLTLTAPKE